MGGGWEKIAGGRKSNVSERLFAFLRVGKIHQKLFIYSKGSFRGFNHQLACNG